MSVRCIFCEKESSEDGAYYHIHSSGTCVCPECLNLVISTIVQHTNIGSAFQPMRLEFIEDSLKRSIRNWRSEKASAMISIDNSIKPTKRINKNRDEEILLLIESGNTKTITVSNLIQKIAVQKLISPDDLPNNEEMFDREEYVKNMLFEELIAKCRSVGAKACIQVDYSIATLANSLIFASASGTAASGTAVVLAEENKEE